MTKKIIFSAGGSGGHIIPAINLMKHFFDKGYKVLLVTDKRGISFIEKNLEFKSYTLHAGTPTNKKFFKKILSFFIILYSLIHSLLILKKEKPDLIIGLGGYVSFPISFCSKFFNLPLVVYENNSVLGRANKYLLSTARKIFIAKEIKEEILKKHKDKVCESGVILDKKILNFERYKKNGDKKYFSILILGGSQGAEIFGEVVPKVIKKLKDKGYDIKINQQCISEQKDSITQYYEKNNIKNNVFVFDQNIYKLISSSDLAITRCGASSIAELAYMLTPFIGIPLPNSIDNHQYLNVKFYKDRNYCWVLEQENLSVENLFKMINEIIENKNNLENIHENLKKNYSKDAYSVIESQINKII